jgi:hypothetical protein
VTDGQPERVWINLDRVQIDAIEFRAGVDIEPASIDIDEPAV